MSLQPRLALALALLSLASLPVEGQVPDSVVTLEPVVVRVLRSAVGTGSPYAVSVAAGEELSRGTTGAYLEEALRALPGVQVQNRFNLASGERLAIRGFGSRAQFGIRGVRVLVDGVPATLPDGQTALDHLDLSTLGRVELLRGPGSAMYGNAAGGVLHFESRAPASQAMATLRTAAGSDGLRTLSADLSGPVAQAGYRIGVSRYGYDGFRRDPVADDGSAFGRQERTVLNAVIDAPLAAGRIRMVVNGLDMAADNPGSLSQALLDEGDRQAFRFSVLQRTREDIRQAQAGATWTGPIGALTAEFSGWGIRRDFEGRIPSDVVAFDRNAGGVRAILSGTGRKGRTRMTLGGGVEVEAQSDDRRNWANERGSAGALGLDQHESVRGTGVFLQARVEPDDAVSVSAGLRFDAFTFRAEDRFLSDGTDDTGERQMRALSPSLGLVFRSRAGLELFGSLATAFETPTTTELANRPEGAGGFNPGLEPTRALTVEGGVRTRPGAAWRAEATVFRTDLRDELVPFEVPSTPGRTFFRNAGASSHQGLELVAEARPVPEFWMRVAYTYVDARFETYAPDGVDLQGRRIPGLSPHRLDGRLALTRGAAYVELRGLYQDAIAVNDDNSATSPSSLVADLRTGLQGLRAGSVTVSPFLAVANVLDRRYNASVVVNAFGGRFFEPGPGRTLQAGVGIRFGGS